MEQNKEKVLIAELKLDPRHLTLEGGWENLLKEAAARVDEIEKEHGYTRTQFRITWDSREF